MLDRQSTSQAHEKKREFTDRQLDLFTRMLDIYLKWAETVPEIRDGNKKNRGG